MTFPYFQSLPEYIKLYIASKVLKVTKDQLLLYGWECNNFMEKISKQYLMEKKPLSKIFQEKPFFKSTFYTNSYTLDPRPDSELLVETTIEFIKKYHIKTVLDLGTGTGALAISVKLECPQVQVMAMDKYNKVLKVAKYNAKNLKANIQFKKNNWLNKWYKSYDLLITNPPYLTSEDMSQLNEYTEHDPKYSLYGGHNGLHFYEKIQQKQYLFKYIIMEISPEILPGIISLFPKGKIFSDLNGLWRMITVES